MKPLPYNADLLSLAPRVVWFESPERAVAEPIRFLTYVMTYGTLQDVAVIRWPRYASGPLCCHQGPARR